MLGNQLDTMKPVRSPQGGYSLVQSLLGIWLSLLVVMAALTAYGWIQISHRELQTQIDVHQRLRSALETLRARTQRAGAPLLNTDSKGKFKYDILPEALFGTEQSLSLSHWRQLTPADCQGHEASFMTTIEDSFSLNKQALVCKDTAPVEGLSQELFEQLDGLHLLYAQAVPGPSLQWRAADEVTQWQEVRGVQICLHAIARGMSAPASSDCTGAGSTSGQSWRGVAAFSHHAP